jgi:protein phosphatase
MVSSFGVSDRGPVRQINEDRFLADDELSLFVVADGMGGHTAGEVASRLAVESIENFVRRSQQSEDFSWPCGVDPQLTFDGNRVRTAIYLANRRVFRAAESNEDYTGMGTTVTCALIGKGQLTIGHVGDSRLYLLTDGVLTVQTRDDTWAATLLAEGGNAPDQHALAVHPMRHVLTNVLGAREQADIHVSQMRLNTPATLLLCTDGVHNVLDDRALGLLVAANCPNDAAQAIIDEAIKKGTRDNVTALVVRYEAADHG